MVEIENYNAVFQHSFIYSHERVINIKDSDERLLTVSINEQFRTNIESHLYSRMRHLSFTTLDINSFVSYYAGSFIELSTNWIEIPDIASYEQYSPFFLFEGFIKN